MQKILLLVVGFVVVGGGAFSGGMRYERQKNSGARQDRQARMQQFGGMGGGQRGTRGNNDLVAGAILSKDEKSMTVKLRDGGSKIVILSDATTITRSVDAPLASLTTGEQVNVTGSVNADGSINAQMIQVRRDLARPLDK
ncbi:hypothetical protein HY624_00310 [Candidatus Uhrbacteria bacterium]|nr:hypothetical protein [Candidatus Uhrbacteria bacterium]